MNVMKTEVVPGPWTRTDLESLPDDGHRYEIIDGVLLVNAAPAPRHQFVIGGLYSVLKAACPDELLVAFAPLDIVLADDTVVEPDVLVARRVDFTARDLPVPPLLAVEVLSPSTRLIDLNMKKERFQRAGIPSYWVVDPDTLTLTVFELEGDTYRTVAEVAGQKPWTASAPFTVTVVPGRLAD